MQSSNFHLLDVAFRLLVRLVLREEHGFHRIVSQENFCHPDVSIRREMCHDADLRIKDVAGLVFPPAAPVVRFALRAFGTVSDICAKASQVLGYWRPGTTGLAGDTYEKYKESSNGQAKSSNASGHESDGTRAQPRKKGHGKKSKLQENRAQESKGPAVSSDSVDDSSNQGGSDELKSRR